MPWTTRMNLIILSLAANSAEANLQFVAPSDPILNQVAEAVSKYELKSPEIQSFLKQMVKFASGNQEDKAKSILVGLAAPQIGVSKRVILVDIGADGKGKVSNLRLYINPELTWKSSESVDWYEGCYSTGNVTGIVSRPNRIKVRAMDINGIDVIEEHEGYVARIFQHEIDHLNGIEFVQHITDDKDLHWVEKNEFPKYRNQEAWRHWDKKCSRNKWLKIKSGT